MQVPFFQEIVPAMKLDASVQHDFEISALFYKMVSLRQTMILVHFGTHYKSRGTLVQKIIFMRLWQFGAPLITGKHLMLKNKQTLTYDEMLHVSAFGFRI